MCRLDEGVSLMDHNAAATNRRSRISTVRSADLVVINERPGGFAEGLSSTEAPCPLTANLFTSNVPWTSTSVAIHPVIVTTRSPAQPDRGPSRNTCDLKV